jgi:hypothetical protein
MNSSLCEHLIEALAFVRSVIHLKTQTLPWKWQRVLSWQVFIEDSESMEINTICCKGNSVTLFASELYRPWDHRLSEKLVLTFADTGYRVVIATDPQGRKLRIFLGRSRYFFFQVAPQLYSRGWVDPVPDPLLLSKCSSSGNRTRASGSLTRNSDH